jgi:hypothetical protein
VGDSQYESEGSVNPAHIQTYSGLRLRFKRGEPTRTEESRITDLYDSLTDSRPPRAG